MAKKYEYQDVNLSELLLDDENPRFASSMLVRGSTAEVSQDAIIAHLCKHSNIVGLAKRINTVQELHGSELITCYKRDGKYVILEGNRRVCACKLLLNRSLIPDEYKNSFPFVTDVTKENIEAVRTSVYLDRESVLSYLSDRHITGVKKWSALEKNNYYMNLFNTYKSFDKFDEYTTDSIRTIKNSIRKYQFFMDVFDVLKSKYNDIEIEKLDYLPMVDRFMGILVGDDQDVGLHLSLDEDTLKYSYDANNIEIYRQILMLIGEAFLLRKENKNCADGELSKIVSTEIRNAAEQKLLIINNVRIPGLLSLIKDYKSSVNTDNADIRTSIDISGGRTGTDGGDTYTNGKGNGTYGGDTGSGGKTGTGVQGEDDKFVPPQKFRPRKSNKEYLSFTRDEAKTFRLAGTSDYEEKVKEVIRDLATLSVYEHPYACALLYRTLFEICTRLVFERYSVNIGHLFNDSNNIEGNMLILNSNFLFAGICGKDVIKIRGQIKAKLSNEKIVDTLNLYIHYSNPVDVPSLLSSWNTMKFYIKACLDK